MAKKKKNFSKSQKGSRPKSPRSKPMMSKKSSPTSRWVVGLHACKEVVEVRGEQIVKAMAKKGCEGEELITQLERRGVDVRWVEDQDLSKLARTHQGMAIEVDGTPEVDWQSIYAQENSIVLVLDSIVDPHNLGAIMRTAWLMGCDAVVTSQMRSVGLTPAVAKVACGAAEHVPLVIESQLPSVMKELKEKGYWVLGLAHSEKNTLYQQDLAGKVAWVIGSEEKGLRKPVAKECDQLVSIPQTKVSASYNASVATAIALAETSRQHQVCLTEG